LLLDAGEDPNRYNPPGAHAHSTPLHQAAAGGHDKVVRLLVERGARVDVKDTIWQGTPADWARHEGRTEIAEWLREQKLRSHEATKPRSSEASKRKSNGRTKSKSSRGYTRIERIFADSYGEPLVFKFTAVGVPTSGP
jgi:ankyrin repeat protein